MTNAIQTFVNTEFGNIRMLNDTLTGKILFCGKDVAEALGYVNPTKVIRERCSGGLKRTLIDTLGREQEAIFIPEGDVYRLIVRSNLPTAEKFERWVFDEVLPAIRETGGYSLSKPQLPDFNNPVIAARAWADEVEKKLALQAKIDADADKVVFADDFLMSKGNSNVAYLAEKLKENGLDVGTNRLFAWLRADKFLCNKPYLNKPTQTALDAGYFECNPYIVHTKYGDIVKYTPYVTPKGMIYFMNLYRD